MNCCNCGKTISLFTEFNGKIYCKECYRRFFLLEKNMKIIAVDSGRSGVKSAIYDVTTKELKKYKFESKFGDVDFSFIKNIPILDFKKENDFICSIDEGSPMAFGKVCDKIMPPENIGFVTSDSIYMEYSVYYTLVAIANLVENNDNVVLGINLTANNINAAEDIKKKLIGNHKVIFYSNTGTILKEINFNIEKMGVFFQSWVGFLDLAIDGNFDIKEEFVKDDSIVIDMGRRTVDVVLIKNLSPVKNMAYELGMEKVLIYIKELLYRKYDVRKTTHELESIVLNKKNITKNGNEINMSGLLKEALIKISKDLRNAILEDFSDYSPERFILIGGGAYLFKDIINKIFEGVQDSEDPVYSNSNGLIKLLVRKFVLNKKGS